MSPCHRGYVSTGMSPCHPAEGLQECHRVSPRLSICKNVTVTKPRGCRNVTMLRLFQAGVKGGQREGENWEQFGGDLSLSWADAPLLQPPHGLAPVDAPEGFGAASRIPSSPLRHSLVFQPSPTPSAAAASGRSWGWTHCWCGRLWFVQGWENRPWADF